MIQTPGLGMPGADKQIVYNVLGVTGFLPFVLLLSHWRRTFWPFWGNFRAMFACFLPYLTLTNKKRKVFFYFLRLAPL